MPDLRNASTVLAVLLVAACSDYHPVTIGEGQTWAEARASATRGSLASFHADGTARHLVLPGDTVSALAYQYATSSAAIVRANGLPNPNRIYAGQVLLIPAGKQAPAAPPAAVAVNVTPPAPRREATPVSVAALPQAQPRLMPAAAPAEQLRVSSPPAPAATVQPAAVASSSQNAGAETQAVLVSSPTPVPQAVTTATAEEIERAATAPTPGLSGKGFMWPVQGTIISAFGAKPDGRRNDGINIAAAAGDPVVAAENGIVVYAGDAIAGFGNMLLIRHADDFVSAYAHASSLLVRVGDRVKRGQVIARVGASGDVRSPQLHFELRAGRSPVDPSKHLKEGSVLVASAGS